MNIRLTVRAEIDAELFDTNEYDRVQAIVKHSNGVVYTWKTTGHFNWLERGYKLADRLGFLVLPKQLPETIDLDDDPIGNNQI